MKLSHPQSPVPGLDFAKTGDVSATTVRWVGIDVDWADAGAVTRFHERLLGFEIGDFEPRRGPATDRRLRDLRSANDRWRSEHDRLGDAK